MELVEQRILRRLDEIQSFIICNTAAAPVTTAAAALYRQRMALPYRERAHRDVLQSIETELNSLPETRQFHHYSTVFELYCGMAYREEIRLDKITDDLQDYLEYYVRIWVLRVNNPVRYSSTGSRHATVLL